MLRAGLHRLLPRQINSTPLSRSYTRIQQQQNFSGIKREEYQGRDGISRASSKPRSEIVHRSNGQGFTDSYKLSDRVKLLATRGELDSAVDLVKTSPPGVGDNVIVWNNLIHEVLKERKWKKGYELWMDMKRRGMTPTTRSYSTFFSGYAKIAEIDAGTLARIKTIYAQWTIYSTKMSDRASNKRSFMEGGEAPEDVTSIPTNAYLTFLGNVKQVDLLLDTFNQMPTDGPLAATTLTYSIVLGALRTSEKPEHFKAAMELWERISALNGPIDTKTVSLIISICREAKRPDDMKVGLEVAKEFYGFVNPEMEDSLVTATVRPRVALDSIALSNVLSLALAMSQFNLVSRWFDQVRDYPKRFGRDVLESQHIDLVMVALAVKKDVTGAEDLLQWMLRSTNSSLKPTLTTFTNAIQVCWRSADLNQANKFLTLMGTASPASNVASTSQTPPATFKPDERIISTMLQTALAMKDRGDIYRTIELVEGLGFDAKFFLTAEPSPSLTATGKKTDLSEPTSPSHPVKNALSYKQFWTYKLGEVFERCLERVLQSPEGIIESTRRRELAIWRGNVVNWLEKQEIKPDPTTGEESMQGRRETLRLQDERRKVQHQAKKEFNEARRSRDESHGDSYRSDQPRSRSNSLTTRDSIRNAFSNGDRSNSGRQFGDGGEMEQERPRRSYSDRPSSPPSRDSRNSRFDSSPRPRSTFTPSSDSDRASDVAAPIMAWPTGQRESNTREERFDRPSRRDFDSRSDRLSSPRMESRSDRPERTSYGERSDRPERSNYSNRESSPNGGSNRSGSSSYGVREDRGGYGGREERGGYGGRSGGDSRRNY